MIILIIIVGIITIVVYASLRVASNTDKQHEHDFEKWINERNHNKP